MNANLNPRANDEDHGDCTWQVLPCRAIGICTQHGTMAVQDVQGLSQEERLVPLRDLLTPAMQLKCSVILLTDVLSGDIPELQQLAQWPYIRADLRGMALEILKLLPVD